jgi:mannose-6-phosphate isomerase
VSLNPGRGEKRPMTPKSELDPRPYLMENRIQHYAWGTRGNGAFIPRLLGVDAEPGCPYAELWIGTHPKAPSAIILDEGGVSLRHLVSQNPQALLGEAVDERFSGELPFLLKVLSTAESLSIQVHPTREQARSLHARDPQHYPDENHKPELAVALGSFAALIGFKRLPEMRDVLRIYPELAGFIGQDVERQFRSAGQPSPSREQRLVRLLCSTLVKRSMSSADYLVESLDDLQARLRRSSSPLREEERVFLDLREEYTGPDVGLFFLFLLNLVHLERGEGVFIEPGVPHAYLKGDIIECMGNSDNVVRVGLTRKFKDPDALLEVLDYTPSPVRMMEADPSSKGATYRTPTEEFRVSWQCLERDQQTMIRGEGKPEILLITEGEALLTWGDGSKGSHLLARRGQSVFSPAALKEFTIRARGALGFFDVEIPL